MDVDATRDHFGGVRSVLTKPINPRYGVNVLGPRLVVASQKLRRNWPCITLTTTRGYLYEVPRCNACQSNEINLISSLLLSINLTYRKVINIA